MADVKNIDGVTILATLKKGWRSKALDKDRLIFTHPDFEPRIVVLADIKPGDKLPRDTDETVSFPPTLTGK